MIRSTAAIVSACLLLALAGSSFGQQQPPTNGTNAPRRGFGGGRGFGGAPQCPDVASPRTDANSQQAHLDLLEKAKKGGIDVYFEGDSITRRWGCLDPDYAKYYKNWQSNFFGWNAADFGWGADSLQNIVWRLENGELDNVNPKVIVFLGGINNINARMTDEQIAGVERGIKKCLDLFQQKAPNATIILTAVFPGKNASATIYRIDADIAKFADGKKIRFLNVNDKLADQDGNPHPGMLNSDGLHPDTAGYQVWADGLKPILTELLGPPAKTDHAPPATGDPSAMAKLRARGTGGQ
jgi:lysophospholipase L1-like esterase